MPTAAEHAAALAARLEGAVALDLRVERAEDLRAWLREVELRGDLAGFEPVAGQDLMVSVADAAGRPRWRRYTLRSVGVDSIVLWVEPTTGGPGARWARGARVRDQVVAVGPRGKVRVDATATDHLFVVDATGLAAMAAMAAALPEAARGHGVAVLEDRDGAERLVAGSLGGLDVVAAADAQAAVRAATRLAGDAASLAAYVLGERSLTTAVAGALHAAGVDAARVAVKAYWRADRPNEDNGEPGREEPPIES